MGAWIGFIAGALTALASMCLGLVLGHRLSRGVAPAVDWSVFSQLRHGSAEAQQEQSESEEYTIARR